MKPNSNEYTVNQDEQKDYELLYEQYTDEGEVL